MIGEQIRQLRLKKGLSLTEFARRVGMSKSMISQIELGKSNPSVETVRQLAAVLQVPVFTLFLEGNDSQDMLVKKDKRIKIKVPDSDAVREIVTPDLRRNMVLLIACLPPGRASSPGFTTHLGEECVFLLRGVITIHLPDESYMLEAGDSFYFPASQPHYCTNPGSSEAEFLSVIVPPTLDGHRSHLTLPVRES
jgi:transcriptional regulator with XRE-family HTH domain